VTNLQVRAIEPDDHDAALAFLRSLSAETTYKRFFSMPHVDDRLLAMVAHPSECCSEALIALVGDEVVGLASFDRLEADPAAADVAIVIGDAWQHHGVGSVLMRKLAGAAKGRGIERFTATVLADNRPVVQFIRQSNPAARLRFDGTELAMEAPLGAA
jgi:GNAT superfamily N-acetyltransferase